MSVVVKGLIVCTDLRVDLIHVVNHDPGYGVIIRVAGFSRLEEDIAVLGAAAQYGMLRVQRAAAERGHGVFIEHIVQILVIPHRNLLNLVRGAEAVEEMEERNSAADGGQMRNRTQIHNLLRVIGTQHGETGLATGINVGMIAKDRKCMSCKSTRRNMNYRGQQLAGHLVHVRNHQKQALRSGIGSRQRACRQRAVHRTGRTSLRLHLRNLNLSAEQIFQSICGILVRFIRHHRGRRDRIDGSYVCKRIRYMRRSGIAVYGFCFSCHVIISSFKDTELGSERISLHSPIPFCAFVYSNIFSI